MWVANSYFHMKRRRCNDICGVFHRCISHTITLDITVLYSTVWTVASTLAVTSSKIPCWCSVDILNTLYLTSAGYNWVKLRHIWHTRAGEHFVRIPHPLALSLPTTRVGNEFVSKRTFHYSNVSSVSRKWDNAE